MICMGRPDWYYDHPPACTCVRCEEARRTGASRKPARIASRLSSLGPMIGGKRWQRAFVKASLIFAIVIGVGAWAHLSGKLPPQIQEWTDAFKTKFEEWLGSPGPVTPTSVSNATPTVTPSAKRVPAIAPTQGIQSYRLAEETVAIRINEFRANRELPVLASNGSLAEVARAHSEDMARRDFFDHANPDGLEPQDRVEHAGLTDFACGENLHMVTNAQRDHAEQIASDAFTGWLNSPGHYENMIKPSYDTGGVGLYMESRLLVGDLFPWRYDIYVTHLLCRDVAEYNRLQAQYEAAEALYDQFKVRYEASVVEYQAIEGRYVNNEVPRSRLDESYEKVQEANIRLNAQVDILNEMVEQMNAASGS